MKVIITEQQLQKLVENTSIIDHILDKITNFGYESLDDNEKHVLKKYSEWLNSDKNTDFSDVIKPKTIDYDKKEGDKFTLTLGNGSEFTFIYDYTDELKSENLHYGVVYWNNMEWVGLFAVNNKYRVTEIDFVCDEDFSGNELRLQDELGKYVYQVKMFLEDEVIPQLMK